MLGSHLGFLIFIVTRSDTCSLETHPGCHLAAGHSLCCFLLGGRGSGWLLSLSIFQPLIQIFWDVPGTLLELEL